MLTVTFTGGELSIRPDLAEILRHTRHQGLLIRMHTNATRVTPDLISLLQEVGAEEICVSIYGRLLQHTSTRQELHAHTRYFTKGSRRTIRSVPSI